MALLLNLEHPEQLDAVLHFFSIHKPVALPSETVYGLAAPFNDSVALEEIFRLKNRPHFNPLIVHVNSSGQVKDLVEEVCPLSRKLMDEFWPGPLTLLFKKSKKVPDLCTGGSPWVAIRSPDNGFFRKVITRAGIPLAAPSANRYQGISPVSSEDVLKELGPHGLEAVVEGGDCRRGLESTVLKVEDAHHISVLRLGALTLESLMDCCGSKVNVKYEETLSSEKEKQLHSPGRVKRHYAPQTACFIFSEERMLDVDPEQDVLLKVLRSDEVIPEGQLFRHVHILSEKDSLEEASQKPYASLRLLDEKKYRRIFLLKTENQHLGRSINDRLQRAASPKKNEG